MKPIKFLFASLPLLLLNFYSCSERSSCEDTMCMNGGVCLDGTCNCPTGFEGVHCQERSTPDYIRITSLTLIRFPEVNEGKTWDDADGPDIFFRLYDGKTVIAQPDYLIENAAISHIMPFDFHFIELSKPESTYRLDFFDYDGVGTKEEFMGSNTFIPFDKLKGFPKSITIDDGGPIAFTMTVDYYYNNFD